jgi:hypothetical protein
MEMEIECKPAPRPEREHANVPDLLVTRWAQGGALAPSTVQVIGADLSTPDPTFTLPEMFKTDPTAIAF